MHERDAIMELENEHHRVEQMAQLVDNLIALMRGLPTCPAEEVVVDLNASYAELSHALTDLFDDEETLIFPALRRHFKALGAELHTFERDHRDLRVALTTLGTLLADLTSRWDGTRVDQAWALADHVRSLFQEHTLREDHLLERVDEQLTGPEHAELVRGLRARRNGRRVHSQV